MHYYKARNIILLSVIILVGLLSCKSGEEKNPKTTSSEVEKKMVEVNRILVAKDRKRIEGYVERMNYEMKESETGLWYQILDWGEGDSIRIGNIVHLDYSISLLDGTTLYSSAEDGIKTFEVGHGGVESGLEEGILLLGENGSARFIMPPHLAHGLPGDGERIPARAILLYEVKVLDVE